MGNTHSDLKTTPTSLAYKHGLKANRSKRELNPTAIYRKFSFCHRSVIVTVHSNDKVCGVKRMVEKELKIPYHQQRLFKKGQERYQEWYGYYHELTDDEEALSEKSDCILIERNVDNVLFVTPDFITLYIIEYSSADTVLDVKWKIEKIDPRIETASHGLLFQGKWLNNEKRLADHNIQKQSTLQLKKLTTIVIKLHNGDPITLEVEADGSETTKCKVCDVKRMIERELKVPYHQQRLLYREWYGYYHELTDDEEALSTKSDCILIERNVDNVLFITPDFKKLYIVEYNSADTVVDVKWKIERANRRSRIQASHKLLFQGKQLNNEKRLADYNILKQSTLQLKKLTTIVIKLHNGDPITLEVEADGSETKVCDVKRTIEREHKVPYHQQQLFRKVHELIQSRYESEWYGDYHELTDDEEALSTTLDYILIEKNIDNVLFITPDFTKLYIVEYNSADTVVDVKRKIGRANRRSRIQTSHKLLFQGKQLNNEKRLADYNILKQSTLQLKKLKTIVIKLHNGDPITLEVEADGSETTDLKVCDVKKIIEKKQNIPYHQQQLFMPQHVRWGYLHELTDDEEALSTESECILIQRNIDDVLFITPDSIELCVIAYNSADTVVDVKWKIEETLSCMNLDVVETARQGLIFQGKELSNEKSLADYSIQKQSTLQLRELTTIDIRIMLANGDSIFLEVEADGSETIKVCDVKRMVEKKLKVPYHQQQLFQEELENEYGYYEFHELKDVLSTKSGCFLIQRNLDNVLFVILPHIHPCIIEYNSADTVVDVKWKIDRVHHCIEPNHGLIFQGKQLNNEKRLADYNIQKHSTLHLRKLTTISIKLLHGDSISLDVKADGKETIKDVKFLIWERLSIPVEEQQLRFKGQKMEDNISLCKFHTSEFLLVPRKCPEMQLFIKSGAGHIISVREYPYNTIADLKTQIQERVGIPSDQQQLTLNGKHLEEVELLSECKIKPECTLYLTTRMHDRFQISVTVTVFSNEIDYWFHDPTVTVEVEPTDSIAHVKTKLLDKLMDIPLREIIELYYKKQKLEDANTVRDYGIRCKSELDLSVYDQTNYSYTTSNGVEIPIVHHTPRRAVPDSQLFINPVPPCTAFQMPVYVRACKCEPPHAISVGISPTSRVEDFASEIQNALEGIECTKFTLTYALDTGNTLVLSNYGIQRESVLFLEKGDRSIVWPPPISFSKIFHPCRQIEHSHLHGLLQYPVSVQTDEKQRIPIIVEPHTTVADLKTNVERRAAIPVSQQYVIFSGKMLEDKKLLLDYGVHRECILQLLKEKPIDITVFVKFPRKGNFVALQLNPSTSIRQVKACIQETKQKPFEQQQLTFAGIVLKDERSLQSYEIDSQCTLYLQLDDTYPINIKMAEGRTISLNVAPTDMIFSIKSEIHIREGIIPEQQELFFGNVRLDDSRTVQSYGIWSMETLMLLKPTDKPAVFIKNITGEVIVLEHCLTKTVAAMKVEVHNERKIPPEKQVMFFRGTQMEDNQTLSNYSIQNHITIHLVPEFSENFRVCVKGQSGKVISLKASPIHSIENVKLMIWHRLGILPDEQYLYYDNGCSDKELSNSQCLSECSIQHGGMLLLLQKPCTLSVRTTTGNVITLRCPQCLKVSDIKLKLCKENVRAQNLRLFWNAQELNDKQSLTDYSILSSLLTNSALLQITNNPVLFVRCYTSNRIVALDYRSGNTIAQLQHQIKELWNTEEEQLLVFDDKVLNDMQTIESCNVQENHILTLIPKEVKVFVTTQTEMWTIFDVDLLDSVEDVKDQIQQEWRIPNKQQKLSFDGVELNNSKMLRSYHIQNESTLLLSLLPWEQDQIAIQMPSKTIVLEVNLQQDTIDDVKVKIDSNEGIPAAHQCLYFKDSKMLRNTQLLGDCGIRNHSSLCLLLKPSTLLVKTPNGRVIQLEWVGDIQSVADLKRKLQEVESVPIEKQLIYIGHTVLESNQVLLDYSILSQFRARGSPTQINMACKPVLFVKCYESGEITALDYDEKCTILDIKQKSCDTFGIQIKQCSLVYKVEAKQFHWSRTVTEMKTQHLMEDRTLLDCSIQEGNTIDLVQVLIPVITHVLQSGEDVGREKRIFIKTLSGKAVFLTVGDSTTVSDLKCMIMKTEPGASLHTQRLIFNGKELIEDEQTLAYYGIGDAATVDLLVKDHSLLIRMHMGKTITVEYDHNDKVSSVKEKIQKKAAILPSRQRLVLGGTGKELKNDDILKDCNVTANTTLNLILKRRMQIQVTTLVGETQSITLDVQAEDTVESSKLLIHVYTGAPPDQQVLYHAGCELNDWMTLSDYRIQNDSTLHLVLLQLHVRTPSGEEIVVRYSESETVAGIKAQLYADTRMPPQEQRLLFCDQELEDRHILGHYHIKNGHTLYLEHIPGDSEGSGETDVIIPLYSDCPKLYQLQHIQGQGGVVLKVMEKVAAHWERLALALHFEGHILEIVKRDHTSDCMTQCRTILFKWLNGEARSPVSWDTLVTCLKEIEFTLLAEGLEAALRK